MSPKDRSAPGVRLTLFKDEQSTTGEPLDFGTRLLSFAFEDCEQLSRIFWESLLRHYRAWAKAAGYASSAVETGAVTGVHRAGASLRVHVHFHLLCLDGIYVSDGDPDASNTPPYLSAAEALATAGMQRGTLLTVRDSDDGSRQDEAPFDAPPPRVSDAVTHERFNLHASVHLDAADFLGRERRAPASVPRGSVQGEPAGAGRAAFACPAEHDGLREADSGATGSCRRRPRALPCRGRRRDRVAHENWRRRAGGAERPGARALGAHPRG
jgi:hypothetical protein